MLRCPACKASAFSARSFDETGEQTDQIVEGVVWCKSCSCWFPVEGRLLDLLHGDLAYPEDRRRFWCAHQTQLVELGLAEDSVPPNTGLSALQEKQQRHFDWYAKNGQQTYAEFEQMPFWKVFDELTFESWTPEIAAGKWLLDVGCAQGRSTAHIADCSINVVAFDISKQLVKEAVDRFAGKGVNANMSFVAADASQFPLSSNCFDYVLVYGVLHHLPDAGEACKEIARVLKPGGIFFGLENNETIFRRIFDFWQKLRPLWHEEAGPQALMGRDRFVEWFRGTGIQVATRSSVYVPPELINLLGTKSGKLLLAGSDRCMQEISFLRNNGGLIVVRGQKFDSSDV